MKKLALVLGLLMALALFSGCASGAAEEAPEAAGTEDTADGEEVVLTWQSYDSIDKYQGVIDAYEAQNPQVKIEFEQVADYTTKLLTEAASGDLPDLVNTNTGTTQVLGEAGVLKEMDIEAIQADADYDFADFWETAALYCTDGGKWYSLPLDGGNYGWVYNKKMFDQCGIEVPEGGFTWSQFEDACKTLLENKDTLGIQYPTIFNDLSSSIDMMYPLITQAGGSYLADDGTCAWNSEAAVAAFGWVQGLVEAGYIPPIEKLGDGYDALITKFNAGEIAMCRVALWNSLYLEDSDAVEWVVMDAPKGDGGSQAEVLFLNGIGISNTSANAEQALDFIMFLTSPEGLELYLGTSASPQTAVRRSQSGLSVAMFDESKNMQVFNTSLDYCGYVELTNTFSEQQDTITQSFDEIWYNGADVQSTLDSLVESVNALLP